MQAYHKPYKQYLLRTFKIHYILILIYLRKDLLYLWVKRDILPRKYTKKWQNQAYSLHYLVAPL